MRRQAALMQVAALVVTSLIASQAAHAQQGEDLREAAQNPIADLISVPFQNNTNFDIGRTDNTQNVLSRTRHKFLVVDIAVQRLVQSEDELRHATKSLSKVLQDSLSRRYA